MHSVGPGTTYPDVLHVREYSTERGRLCSEVADISRREGCGELYAVVERFGGILQNLREKNSKRNEHKKLCKCLLINKAGVHTSWD